MKLRYHPRARIELNENADYYQGLRSGLGLEFLDEVQLTLRRILDFPHAWQRLSENTRRCLMNRFPFGVIYQVKAEEVRIIAIAHQKRRPDYWRGRVGKS